MRIIDFHTHIYPERIAEKATASTCVFYDLQTDLVGTAQVLLKEGKKAGISEFVLLPVAVRPEQTRSINQFILRQVREHKEFYGFGTIHGAMERMAEEIAFLRENGFRGVKLHPDIQGIAIDDPRLFPAYELLEDKLPVLIHCGDPRHDNSHPRRLRRVLDSFPHLQVIAAHLGGWSIFETAAEYLQSTDCFLDLSSCFPFLTTEQARKYISLYGAGRILFGTDFPLWSPRAEVEAFCRLGLPAGEMEQIASGNALTILKAQ